MTDSLQQLLNEFPFLLTLWDAICVIVPLSAMLAFSGLYFMSSTAEILAINKKRSAFNKCGRQISMLGLILGWSLLIGSRVWLYYTQVEHVKGSLTNYMLELSWMLLSMGVLLSTSYFLLWRILKNMPVLHVTLGMISAVQNCVALICTLFTIRLMEVLKHPDSVTVSLSYLFPESWNAPFWTACLATIPLVLAMPGAFSACWLVIRRKYDDFGRDYYNAMIPWCLGWARNAWAFLVLLLFTSVGLRYSQPKNIDIITEQDMIYDGSFLLLWIIPLLCWIIVKKSEIPLRHAWLLFVALLVAICFFLNYFMEISFIN